MSLVATPGAPPAERRIAPRFRPAFGTVYRVTSHNGNGQALVGLVWNISETGVSMLLADPPECGTRLEGELAPESGGTGLTIPIRVVHVHEMPNGDSFLGAQFARPLTPDELQTFLAPPLPALTTNPKPAEPNGA